MDFIKILTEIKTRKLSVRVIFLSTARYFCAVDPYSLILGGFFIFCQYKYAKYDYSKQANRAKIWKP